MKVDNQFFQNRNWLPILSIVTVLALILTIYFGYLILQNTRADSANIQQIRELQSISDNALFFAKETVTGDESAITPFISTVDLMTETVSQLQNADDYTRENLATEYEVLATWQSERFNAEVLGDIAYAVRLVNASQQRLENAYVEAEKLVLENVAILTQIYAPQILVDEVALQPVLIRQMADNLRAFAEEERPSRLTYNKYRASVRNFEDNYGRLTQGNLEEKLPALLASRIEGTTDDSLAVVDQRVRENIDTIYNLLNGNRSAERYINSAVEDLLVAREAQQSIVDSFDNLQLTLGIMADKLEEFEGQRFPSIWHAVLTGIILILGIIALIVYQRVSSRVELEREQEEGQQTQAAILRLLDELVDLADGDLTVSATVTEDFTGAIADSINYTVDQLRQLVSRINSTAVQVSAGAQDSQQTALHLAEASDHQAQEIAGASAAINEMAVTIDQVSANAAESALVANKAVSIAKNGSTQVQNTINGMDTIREQIQDTSKRIKRLGESSQEIGDIVSLINDIADQTNILALNAAIQASMAGDAGRGFAVVADEVQRLAERSAAATKQIEQLVTTIQSDTNEAVISMEQTTTEVVGGARLAQDAGVALEEIEHVSTNIADLVQNISNAARQQASSAAHVSNTMNVIQDITSQTSAGTGATAQAIGDLADMALELRESVAGFKLPGSEAEDDEAWDESYDASDEDYDLADELPEGELGVDPDDDSAQEILSSVETDLSSLFDEDDIDTEDENMDALSVSDGEAYDLTGDESFDLDDTDVEIHEDTVEVQGVDVEEASADQEDNNEEFDLTDFDFSDEPVEADATR